MVKIRVCSDLQEGALLWKQLLPRQNLFDLWEIRLCFQNTFARAPHFIVAEEQNLPVGLLPLSLIEENGSFGYFPGETWEGRTWLEQNRVPSAWLPVGPALWDAAPENTEVRYLHQNVATSLPGITLDEVGFVFPPKSFHFDFDTYWKRFSRKSRKQLGREIENFENRGTQYGFNNLDDIDWLFDLNLRTFKERSYFRDPRFLNGFDAMLSYLSERKMLRVTTIRVKGKRAAVDVGAIYRNGYTVLAGATDPAFLGIAKLMNLFHIKWACERRLELVDFLCGDFGWKTRFHLHPRPFYKKNKGAVEPEALSSYAAGRRSVLVGS